MKGEEQMQGGGQNRPRPSSPVGIPPGREPVHDGDTVMGEADGMMGSPFKSPSKRIFYSDRFIPARRDSVDFNYSLLDRGAAADEVSRSATSREVMESWRICFEFEKCGECCRFWG